MNSLQSSLKSNFFRVSLYLGKQNDKLIYPEPDLMCSKMFGVDQGYNAREIYFRGIRIFCFFFETERTAWHGIHLLHKKSIKYSGHRKLLFELSKFNALNHLGYWTNTDAYFCLQIPPRENWFQYVHWVYTTAINFPCIITSRCWWNLIPSSQISLNNIEKVKHHF